MRLRKRARMMQPPRQIVASEPMSSSQSYAATRRRAARSPARRRPPCWRTARCWMSSTRPSAARRSPSRAGPGERLRRRVALVAQRRQRAREHGLGDAGQRHAELERVLARPAPGALLLGLVDDHVDAAGRRCRVLLGEHLRRDLDQERLEVAGVPLVEDAGDLGHRRARRRGAAGRRPRRSAGCRRTRCRCGPSSRSGRRRPGRCRCSTASPSTWAAIEVSTSSTSP